MAGAGPHERPRFRYLQEPVPIFFPESEQVPETAVHFRVKTALYLVLERQLRGKAFVGSDQFMYWVPNDPKQCLAPDLMVRLGMSSAPVRSFKTWEHGAPQVAVEILSAADSRDNDWSAKLERYCRAGVGELVRFDPEAKEVPLALWDLADGNVFQRDLGQEGSRRSEALGAYWVVQPHPELGSVLRLATDPEGYDLWPTPEEVALRERAAKEAERAAKEAALARVAELEQQLRER
jgi:Uma2 family endonuclease